MFLWYLAQTLLYKKVLTLTICVRTEVLARTLEIVIGVFAPTATKAAIAKMKSTNVFLSLVRMEQNVMILLDNTAATVYQDFRDGIASLMSMIAILTLVEMELYAMI